MSPDQSVNVFALLAVLDAVLVGVIVFIVQRAK